MTISSITETRINEQTNRFLKNHYSNVLLYATTDPKDINGSGTAIIIDRNLSTHIHEVEEEPGRAITLTLKFKNKTTVTITSIYNKARRDKRISREIINHLKKYEHIDHRIIMGDLNENRKSKGPITKYLEGADNLINIATIKDLQEHPTWQRGNSLSTIDYIWTTPSIMANTTDFEICDPEEWLDTDHQALVIEMNTTGITDNSPKVKRKY